MWGASENPVGLSTIQESYSFFRMKIQNWFRLCVVVHEKQIDESHRNNIYLFELIIRWQSAFNNYVSFYFIGFFLFVADVIYINCAEMWQEQQCLLYQINIVRIECIDINGYSVVLVVSRQQKINNWPLAEKKKRREVLWVCDSEEEAISN